MFPSGCFILSLIKHIYDVFSFENNFDLYCIHWYNLEIFYPFYVVLSVSFYSEAKAVLLARLIVYNIVYAVQTELFRCSTFLL